MSALQREAKPLISKLITGADLPDEPDWGVISRWASVVACSLEFYDGRRAVAQCDRDALMKGAMPSKWVVALGADRNGGYSGSTFLRLFVESRNGAAGKEMAEDQPRIRATMFGIGKAVFLVISLSSEAENSLPEPVSWGFATGMLVVNPPWTPFVGDFRTHFSEEVAEEIMDGATFLIANPYLVVS